jgi:hypothetical protein
MEYGGEPGGVIYYDISIALITENIRLHVWSIYVFLSTGLQSMENGKFTEVRLCVY